MRLGTRKRPNAPPPMPDMAGTTKFKPNTVYVTYIASTPDKVWQALTDPVFTKAYFFGHAIEIEPKIGGNFVLRMPVD